jgi:penicillin amidase
MKRKITAFLILAFSAALLLIPASSVHSVAAPSLSPSVEILLPEVLAALQEPAYVVMDPSGVPHIFAENTHDLYVVTGYVQARDRLFQMDVTRRQASGTLAELLGPDALASDVQLRTLGLRRAAELSEQVLSPEGRAEAEAFAAGVNAFIEQAQAVGKLPPEYGVLEITRVEPWTVTDSLVVGKAIAFDQSLDLDVGNTIAFLTYVNALSRVGLDGAALFTQDLFRSAPAERAAVIPDAQGSSPAAAQTLSRNDGGVNGLADWIRPSTLKLLRGYYEKLQSLPSATRKLFLGERPGSNWFVISGEHTANGAPIIANDPHLSLTNPGIWYEMHQVVEGELSVTGVTLPGVPYVLLGCTARACWTPTTNPLDVTDMFSEQIVPDESGRLFSLFRGKLEPVQVIPQTYRVNVIGDGVMDDVVPAPADPKIPPATLIIPRHGPIVNFDQETGEAVSIQFTGFYPTREFETFRLWDRAQTIEDFQEGLRFFDVGSFNWGYADADGNIAYFTSGKVPLREDLEQGFVDLIPPFFIRDGTGTLQHQWVENPEPSEDQPFPFKTLPPEEMPHVINPPSGFIVSANNDPTGATLDNNPLNQLRPTGGIYYLNYSYDPGYRAARLTELIRARIAQGGITVDEAKAFLADTTMLVGKRLTPFLLSAIQTARSAGAPPPLKGFLRDPRLARAAQFLEKWSYNTPTGLTEGFDWGKPAGVRPTASQIDDSAATTIFHLWLSRLIANTVDGVLGAISPQMPKPGNHDTVKALIHFLESFETSGGRGASGIPFFSVPGLEGVPPEITRDIILLQSLKEALDLLSGEAFASVYNGSPNPKDYLWGKIHRIIMRHIARFGGPFDLPPDGSGFATDGGYQVIDRSDPNVRGARPEAFQYRAGPSRRFVAELRPDGARPEQVLPGGQSGVPGAKHYGDQLPLWLTNRFHPLLTDTLAIYQNAESWQDFFPLLAQPGR